MSRTIGSFRIDEKPRNTSVLIAESAHDLLKIGKLRYSLYVARDGKSYPYADRASASLLEPVDANSLNLFGLIQDSCCTAMRVTKARVAVQDEYLNRLLANAPFDATSYDKLMVVSRLTTSPGAESRALMLSVIRESYRIALRNGIAFTAIATRASLLPFFARLGFVHTGQTYSEAIAGEMHVVVLDLLNRSHLESVHSIFVDVLNELEKEQMAGLSA